MARLGRAFPIQAKVGPSGSLSGVGSTTSSGAGTLGLAIPLTGSGTSDSRGTGTLIVAIPLAGQGSTSSSATGGMGLGLQLSGLGSTASVGSVGLSVTIPLAGLGTASGVGLGGLTVAVPLAGSGTSNSVGQAGLWESIPLSGAGSTSSSASGGLTFTLSLTGTGSTGSVGAGTFTVRAAPLPGLSGRGRVNPRMAAAIAVETLFPGGAYPGLSVYPGQHGATALDGETDSGISTIQAIGFTLYPVQTLRPNRYLFPGMSVALASGIGLVSPRMAAAIAVETLFPGGAYPGPTLYPGRHGGTALDGEG